MKTVSDVRHKPRKSERAQKTKLQQLREKAGLGVRDVGRFSAISASTISRIECGKSPDIHTALVLAAFFETTVEDLFGPRQERSKP